jgi:hypothetical protein
MNTRGLSDSCAEPYFQADTEQRMTSKTLKITPKPTNGAQMERDYPIGGPSPLHYLTFRPCLPILSSLDDGNKPAEMLFRRESA